MNLKLEFKGRDDPFEGDRTLHLKTIPEKALISHARVIATPQQCVEQITFRNGSGDWGATRESDGGQGWVVVDFHARRTVSQVRARVVTALDPNLNPAEVVAVQVDLGGAWLRLAYDGTVVSDPDDPPLTLADIGTGFATHPLPPLQAQRLKLQRTLRLDQNGDVDTNVDNSVEVSQLTVISHPNNLSLSLGDALPFWARPGEMTQEESSPDFAEILQAFLTEAGVVNGFYDVPLVVHSDTIACLDITVEIEYVTEEAVLPAGVTETTLPFNHNGQPEAEADLLQIQLPAGARVVPGKTAGHVVGSFQESRIVHGPKGAVDTAHAVAISTGQSQAHPIRLDKDVAATAIDLKLAVVGQKAVIDLVLLDDTDGKPGLTPKLSAPVTITLDSDRHRQPTWFSAALPAEFQFKKGERTWLVLQSREGEVRWSVNTEAVDVGLHFSADGGLSWQQTVVPKIFEPAAGLFRLRHVPPRFQMPIDLQVGSGAAAEIVSLERFAPLRRVDFDLNFKEVGEAINRFLDKDDSSVCPEMEHLANGDFSAWTAIQESIAPPRIIPVEGADFEPFLVAVAPDCQAIYLAGTADDSGNLFFLDTLTNLPVADITLNEFSDGYSARFPELLFIHPNNHRAYLIDAQVSPDSFGADHRLWVIDLENLNNSQRVFDLEAGFHDMALSADGNRLYLTGIEGGAPALAGLIHIVETVSLEPLPGNLSISPFSDIPDREQINLGANLEPLALAINQAETLLYVVIFNSSTQQSEVRVFDTAALEEVGILAGNLDVQPSRIVLTPDDSQLIVLFDDNSDMLIINTSDGTIATLEGRIASAIVVSPDSRRAFAIDNVANELFAIDLLQKTVTGSVQLNASFTPGNIAISPTGDRVYVPLADDSAYLDDQSLASILINTQLPDEWFITSGSVMPFCFAHLLGRVALLGISQTDLELNPNPTALSQTVPVTAGCAYTFSFWAGSTGIAGVAEVMWLGEGCASLQVDEIPIDLFIPETDELVLTPPELVLHKALLTAPAGATQAEIRFTVPGNGTAVVDQVSFQATQEAVQNSDFQFRPEGELANWALSPAGATVPTFETQNGEIFVGNTSPSPITLLQTFPVSAGQPFTFTFQGRPAQISAAPPHIELRWLTAEKTPATEATVLNIEPQDADLRLLSGVVPESAVEAELHLILPGRTTLAVANISFRPVEMVQVPLTFIAQSPGELTISDFRVAIDETVAALPPVPETGLCSPTPPGREPGSGSGNGCYCPCCGGDKQCGDMQPAETTSGRPVMQGDCPDCGATLVQPGRQTTTSRATSQPIRISPEVRRTSGARSRSRELAVRAVAPQPPAILPMEEEIAALLPLTPAGWAELAGTTGEVALPSLTAIKGIGPARVELLGQLGLSSVAGLATADREVIAAGVQGVSAGQASDFITNAQALMKLAEAQQAPLVSCIMPTFNRPVFVPKAIEYFLRQDYPHRELIIIDDGTEPIGDLVPQDDRIQYIFLEDRLTIGAKMNVGCEQAGGNILVRWEDDVWMDYWRLSYQVAALLQGQADLCGPDHYLHYDIHNHEAWHSTRPAGNRPWILGSTLSFTRSYWEQNPFPDMNLGDEIQFIRNDLTAKRVTLQATTFLVDIIHGGNAAPKNTSSKRWHSFPVNEIQSLMGNDWAFYRSLSEHGTG